MATNEIIKTSTAITFNTGSLVNKELRAATDKICKIFKEAGEYAQKKNRELADILYQVREKKCYTDDGFSSVADYANTVFGIARQNAYALAQAGSKYADETLRPEVKTLPPSKMAEIARVNSETLNKDYEAGKFTSASTQKELRAYANVESSKKETNKGRKAALYNIVSLNSTMYLPQIVNAGDKVGTIESWGNLIEQSFLDLGRDVWAASQKTVNGIKTVYVSGIDVILVEYVPASEAEEDKHEEAGAEDKHEEANADQKEEAPANEEKASA